MADQDVPQPPDGLLSEETKARIRAEEEYRSSLKPAPSKEFLAAEAALQEVRRNSAENKEIVRARNQAIAEREVARRAALTPEQRSKENWRTGLLIFSGLFAFLILMLWAVGTFDNFKLPGQKPPVATGNFPTLPPNYPARRTRLGSLDADLIRDVCLGDVTAKLASSPNAPYSMDDMPQFAAGRWNWVSTVEDFNETGKFSIPFTCVVEGDTMNTANISTQLR